MEKKKTHQNNNPITHDQTSHVVADEDLEVVVGGAIGRLSDFFTTELVTHEPPICTHWT